MRLIHSGRLPDHVEAVDIGTSTLELPSLLRGRSKVIIIDAVDTDDVPGTIVKFPVQELSSTFHRPVSLHGAGVLDAFWMLRILGIVPEAECYGIIPQDTSTRAIRLSPPVDQAVAKLTEMILNSLSRSDTDAPASITYNKKVTAL